MASAVNPNKRRDGRDAVLCHRPREHQRKVILGDAAAVAVDDDGPPAGRWLSRGKLEGEVDLIGPLRNGGAGPRPDLWNERLRLSLGCKCDRDLTPASRGHRSGRDRRPQLDAIGPEAHRRPRTHHSSTVAAGVVQCCGTRCVDIIDRRVSGHSESLIVNGPCGRRPSHLGAAVSRWSCRCRNHRPCPPRQCACSGHRGPPPRPPPKPRSRRRG